MTPRSPNRFPSTGRRGHTPIGIVRTVESRPGCGRPPHPETGDQDAQLLARPPGSLWGSARSSGTPSSIPSAAPASRPGQFRLSRPSTGADAAVASCVGDDGDGREIRDRLRDWALDTRYLAVDATHPTGVVTVRLDEHGVADYDIREGEVAWDFIPFGDALLDPASRADAVCFGSLGQRRTTSRAMIRRFLDATRPECLRVFDVNLRLHFYDREIIEHLLLRSPTC